MSQLDNRFGGREINLYHNNFRHASTMFVRDDPPNELRVTSDGKRNDKWQYNDESLETNSAPEKVIQKLETILKNQIASRLVTRVRGVEKVSSIQKLEIVENNLQFISWDSFVRQASVCIVDITQWLGAAAFSAGLTNMTGVVPSGYIDDYFTSQALTNRQLYINRQFEEFKNVIKEEHASAISHLYDDAANVIIQGWWNVSSTRERVMNDAQEMYPVMSNFVASSILALGGAAMGTGAFLLKKYLGSYSDRDVVGVLRFKLQVRHTFDPLLPSSSTATNDENKRSFQQTPSTVFQTENVDIPIFKTTSARRGYWNTVNNEGVPESNDLQFSYAIDFLVNQIEKKMTEDVKRVKQIQDAWSEEKMKARNEQQSKRLLQSSINDNITNEPKPPVRSKSPSRSRGGVVTFQDLKRRENE